jgi:hypothetical protein
MNPLPYRVAKRSASAVAYGHSSRPNVSSTDDEFRFLKFNLVVRTDCGPRFLASLHYVFKKRLRQKHRL